MVLCAFWSLQVARRAQLHAGCGLRAAGCDFIFIFVVICGPYYSHYLNYLFLFAPTKGHASPGGIGASYRTSISSPFLAVFLFSLYSTVSIHFFWVSSWDLT